MGTGKGDGRISGCTKDHGKVMIRQGWDREPWHRVKTGPHGGKQEAEKEQEASAAGREDGGLIRAMAVQTD